MIQEIQSCFEVKTESEVAFKIELFFLSIPIVSSWKRRRMNELLYQLSVKCNENETKYKKKHEIMEKPCE